MEHELDLQQQDYDSGLYGGQMNSAPGQYQYGRFDEQQ